MTNDGVKGTKVMIKELNTDLNDYYTEKNGALLPNSPDFEHFYIECRVQQKLETIVMRSNGRKILKFNIVDSIDEKADTPQNQTSMIECICYDETHDIFEPILNEGQCYRIYNPDIKFANKKHTQVQNDYRLIVKENVTDIQPIENRGS